MHDPPARTNGAPVPARLGDLPWTAAATHLRADPRILLPVGTCLQHGPHLPLSTDTVIATRLAHDLSARHGILVAPPLPYGVVSRREREYAGTSPLERKTLHRVLNELVGAWESQGAEKIFLLTVHGFGPHISAVATVVAERALIRAVDIHSVDLADLLEGGGGPEHGGEMETSLMLHLAPDLVRPGAIEDLRMEDDELRRHTVGEEPVPPAGGPGVVGAPSLATADKGRKIYDRLVGVLGERVFAHDAD